MSRGWVSSHPQKIPKWGFLDGALVSAGSLKPLRCLSLAQLYKHVSISVNEISYNGKKTSKFNTPTIGLSWKESFQ
jgi:hypothetical protein